jgi:hypothetical protein
LPTHKTGLPFIDSLSSTPKRSAQASLPQLGARIDKSPLELYLPYLNLGLIVVLALGGMLLREGGAWPGFGLLPGVVYGLVIGAKWIMGSVDVGELDGLKYNYKGA